MSLGGNASAIQGIMPRGRFGPRADLHVQGLVSRVLLRFSTSILPTFSKNRSFTRTYRLLGASTPVSFRAAPRVDNLDVHLAALAPRCEVARASDTRLLLTFDSDFQVYNPESHHVSQQPAQLLDAQARAPRRVPPSWSRSSAWILCVACPPTAIAFNYSFCLVVHCFAAQTLTR